MTTEITEQRDMTPPAGNDDVLVRVEGVSKRFCRSLKKSLFYGVQDIASELVGRRYEHDLRPDEFWAIADVSFELRRGECLGLIDFC
jgi:lipopolysaccharide transport system ATP-binding protein